jgi:hypothetical protein
MSAADNEHPAAASRLSPEAMARILEGLRTMEVEPGAPEPDLAWSDSQAHEPPPPRSRLGRAMVAGGLVLVSAALAVPVQGFLFGPGATQAALERDPDPERISGPFEVAAAGAASAEPAAPPIQAAAQPEAAGPETAVPDTAAAAPEPDAAPVTTAARMVPETVPVPEEASAPDAAPLAGAPEPTSVAVASLPLTESSVALVEVAETPAPVVEEAPLASIALAEVRLPEVDAPAALDLSLGEAAPAAPVTDPVVETAAVEARPADAPPAEAPLPDVVLAEVEAPQAPVIDATPVAAVAQAPRLETPELDIPETTGNTAVSRGSAEPRRTRTAALGSPAMSPVAPAHQAAPMPPVDVAKAPPETPEVDDGWLLTRARGLIEQGDISGARLVLEHALSAGSRRAAFHLAETYDPRILASWRALGIRGDANRARELYARASEGGVAGSRERLLGLK